MLDTAFFSEHALPLAAHGGSGGKDLRIAPHARQRAGPGHRRGVSSWYAPPGITPLEMMAWADLVVRAVAGGSKSTVLDDMPGLVVPPNTSATLAAKLAAPARDPDPSNWTGQAGQRQAHSQYTWHQVAQQTTQASPVACAQNCRRMEKSVHPNLLWQRASASIAQGMQRCVTTVRFRYYDPIRTFNELTSVPMLISTSFNARGTPLVFRLKNTVVSFCTSPLNILATKAFPMEKHAPQYSGELNASL